MLFATAIWGNAMAQHTLTVTVSNPGKAERSQEPVTIPLNKYPLTQRAEVKMDGNTLPYQLDDLDKDGIYDELFFLVNLDKKAEKKITVTLFNNGHPEAFPPKVYAELLLRNSKVKEKNKHDIYLQSITAPKGTNMYSTVHHHGMAFESEYCAYRVYFDNRQTVDMYGKYKHQLEIKETQFYPTEEQKAQGYGDDVLWVGNTYGLGAMRGWNGQEQTLLNDVNFITQRVLAAGPLRTICEIENRGWLANASLPRITMTVRYTLYAGHRDCNVEVFFNRNVENYLFSTGIINVKNSTQLTDKKGLRACWGTDWPAGANDTIGKKRETVGLGIFIPKRYIANELPNGDNLGYVVKTKTRQLHYYINFASENENNGFKDDKSWYQYLKAWKKQLESPVKIKISE